MRWFLSLFSLVLVSCGGHEMLEVRQFQLRQTDAGEMGNIDSMVRGEMNKRLHGAVTAKERKSRLGQYYDVSWSQLTGTQPVTIIFEYRQAATGSKILRKEQKFQPATSGTTSFAIIGEDFQKRGRATMWQITLLEGGVEKDSRRSYIWR